VSPQLSWTHYRYLIEIDNEKERAFYQHKTIIHSWSVRELQKSIKDKLYENTSPKDIQSIFQNKQYEHEQPTIGLIICREAGREEVIYALDGLEEKIFIAKYKVKLPSETKIKKVIKKF
jgi:hypothetical protein